MEEWVLAQENELFLWSRPMGFRERRGNCSTHLVTAPLPWGPSRVLQGVPVQTPSQQALVWVWALNEPYLVSCCLRRQFLHSKPGSWSSSQRALWGPKSGGSSTIAREGGELFWFVPYKCWRHNLISDCPITPIMTCNGTFAHWDLRDALQLHRAAFCWQSNTCSKESNESLGVEVVSAVILSSLNF